MIAHTAILPADGLSEKMPPAGGCSLMCLSRALIDEVLLSSAVGKT